MNYLLARLGERSTVAGILLFVEQTAHLNFANIADINTNLSGLIAAVVLCIMQEKAPPPAAPDGASK
ncbi:MAG: hypothetical protein EPO08_00740 [Rhodospirillaceae bacterium]|nr:MAG: hypothetical protein EPO08_00740 [Rhodospirillaceae bacterium]